MKVNEIRNLDAGRLNERLQEIDQELFNLRFQKQTGRLTNTARYGQLKQEYARIKTVLHERTLAAQVGEARQ
jgi:large subunit ribosomal protein L29